MLINGVDLGEIDLKNYTSPCCPEWINLCGQWNSGRDTAALVKIESRSGNGWTDLGIDDIFFGRLNKDCISTGSAIFQSAKPISIYPNPVEKEKSIRIKFNDLNFESFSITIRNILGQIIYSENINAGNNSNDKLINLSAEETEIYFLSIQSTSKNNLSKILIREKIIIK